MNWCLNLKPLRRGQGCQMVYFQTQNPNLGKFWKSCKDM
jgi:hypothetical protein